MAANNRWEVEWLDRGQLRRMPLDRPIRIGRAPGNDIIIDDPKVSRNHCTLTPGEGGVLADGRGSANGIEVDGVRCANARLGPGSVLRIGPCEFRVRAAVGSPGGPRSRRPAAGGNLEPTAMASGQGPNQGAPARPLMLEWSEHGRHRHLPVTRPVSIGRATGNDIVLDDPAVSRRHCVVTPGPRGITVDASMSSNGVSAGGHRTSRADLALGESFVAGNVHFAIAPSVVGSAFRTRLSTPIALVAGIGGLVVAVMIAGGLGVLLLTRSGNDTNDSSNRELSAVTGTAPELIRVDGSWRAVSIGEARLRLRYPESWQAEVEDGSTLVLAPPEAVGHPAERISFQFDASTPFQAGTSHAGLTTPTPITIGGVRGEQYEHLHYAIPTSAYFIDLPMNGGTLSIAATKGPAVNLVPQLQEILKTLQVSE